MCLYLKFMKKLGILLVEDDPDDIELMQEALVDNRIPYQMETISQGDRVLSYLESCKNFPDIVILDLNLPKLHGREVLTKIKTSSQLRNIPVVILTTSSSPVEKEFCIKAGASSFITKPSTVDGFNATVAEIVNIALLELKS